MMFSARFSFLNQERILGRASLVLTILRPSRLGPCPCWRVVRIPTISPLLTC